MLTLLPKGVQTKLLKLFCLKIFPICHRWHRWCNLSHVYIREFSKKFEMTVMVYSGAWGKLKSKSSWHCPCKRLQIWAQKFRKAVKTVGGQPFAFFSSIESFEMLETEKKLCWKDCTWNCMFYNIKIQSTMHECVFIIYFYESIHNKNTILPMRDSWFTLIVPLTPSKSWSGGHNFYTYIFLLVVFFDTMLSCLIYSNLSLFEHNQINYQTKTLVLLFTFHVHL
jgi:hypothetical protein